MAVLFPICFVREHNGYKLASARAVTTAPDPAQQWVVWSLVEKNAPAHYLNYGTAEGGYVAACGKQLPGMGGLTEFATIEQMEAEKRPPCADCNRALLRYVDTANYRKHSAGDQRYIEIQHQALKLESQVPKRSK